MDIVSDALFDDRRLRALTVIDAFTREALAIEVHQGIKGEQVVEAMTRSICCTRPRSQPNERWKLTVELEENQGDPQPVRSGRTVLIPRRINNATGAD